VVGGLLLVIGMVVTAQPAAAIVGGERDEVHTNVGLIRFTTQEGRFRCSGTLISPTVVLTAGHCTGDTGSSPATDVYVSFNTDLPLDPLAPGISPAESAARAAALPRIFSSQRRSASSSANGSSGSTSP